MPRNGTPNQRYEVARYVLRLRTGDVNIAALRLTGGDLGQDMSYVVGCNRLNE